MLDYRLVNTISKGVLLLVSIFWALPPTANAQTLFISRSASTEIDGPNFNDTTHNDRTARDNTSVVSVSDKRKESSAGGGGITEVFGMATAGGHFLHLDGEVSAEADQFSQIGSYAVLSAQLTETIRFAISPGFRDQGYSIKVYFALDYYLSNTLSPGVHKQAEIRVTYGFGFPVALQTQNMIFTFPGRWKKHINVEPFSLGKRHVVRDGDIGTIQFSARARVGILAEAGYFGKTELRFGGTRYDREELASSVNSFELKSSSQSGAAMPADPFVSAALETTPTGILGFQVIDSAGNPVELPPGAITIESLAGPLPVFGALIPGFSGNDNFEEPARDENKWGPASGTGMLVQTNAHVEYAASSSGESSVEWPWIQDAGTLSDHWELKADLASTNLLALNSRAEMGLSVTNSETQVQVGLTIHQAAEGAHQKAIRTTGRHKGQPFDVSIPVEESAGAIRILYNAITKELSTWYDPNGSADGYSWRALHMVHLDYPSPQSTTHWFRPALYARSSGAPVQSGTLAIDNFRGSRLPTSQPKLNTLTFSSSLLSLEGTALPGRILSVERSTDLSRWLPFENVLSSADGKFTLQTTNTALPQLFFRVMQ